MGLCVGVKSACAVTRAIEDVFAARDRPLRFGGGTERADLKQQANAGPALR